MKIFIGGTRIPKTKRKRVPGTIANRNFDQRLERGARPLSPPLRDPTNPTLKQRKYRKPRSNRRALHLPVLPGVSLPAYPSRLCLLKNHFVPAAFPVKFNVCFQKIYPFPFFPLRSFYFFYLITLLLRISRSPPPSF